MMTPLQALVLHVVSNQSESYLISPDASAFVAEGLWDAPVVEQSLIELQDMGYVAFFTDDVETKMMMYQKDEEGNIKLDPETGAALFDVDDDGNPKIETITETVDSGWQTTDEGRKALADYGN